jgi:hypothetical protein
MMIDWPSFWLGACTTGVAFTIIVYVAVRLARRVWFFLAG